MTLILCLLSASIGATIGLVTASLLYARADIEKANWDARAMAEMRDKGLPAPPPIPMPAAHNHIDTAPCWQCEPARNRKADPAFSRKADAALVKRADEIRAAEIAKTTKRKVRE